MSGMILRECRPHPQPNALDYGIEPEEYDDTELKRQEYIEKKQKDFIAKKSYRRNKTNKRRSK